MNALDIATDSLLTTPPVVWDEEHALVPLGGPSADKTGRRLLFARRVIAP